MMIQSAAPWVVLARILRPQGRKGEVLAELFSDFPDQLPGRKGLYLAAEGFEGAPEQARPVDVLAAWQPSGRNEGRIVLHLSGVTDISSAERLKGLDLITAEQDRLPLDDGAAYISDLVGCTVFDGERVIGTVTDLQFPLASSGGRQEEAAPLLVVIADTTSPHSPADEILIPYVAQFIVTQDLAGRRIVMRLPDGLVDVNSSSTDTK
jgi:16S rRNA processing protein RimM